MGAQESGSGGLLYDDPTSECLVILPRYEADRQILSSLKGCGSSSFSEIVVRDCLLRENLSQSSLTFDFIAFMRGDGWRDMFINLCKLSVSVFNVTSSRLESNPQPQNFCHPRTPNLTKAKILAMTCNPELQSSICRRVLQMVSSISGASSHSSTSPAHISHCQKTATASVQLANFSSGSIGRALVLLRARRTAEPVQVPSCLSRIDSYHRTYDGVRNPSGSSRKYSLC